MSYNLEELAVIAAVTCIIFTLSLFYGLFWSLLLVFTVLFLLYKYGRPRRKFVEKSTSSLTRVDGDDVEDTVYSDGALDVPFTGLPSPKIQSLRSPMPLLSTVTKRLSFNTSSFTPRDANRTVYRRSFGSPSPVISQQSPRHFSLINPKFQQQQQPTIKIAPPPIERLNVVQEEASKEVSDPLARSTILSALKQSTARKRAVYEDDDDVDFVTQQNENTKKKRRYNYDLTTTESPYAERTGVTSLNITQDILVNQNENTMDITTTQSKTFQEENSRDFDKESFANLPGATGFKGIDGLIKARLKRRPLHSDGEGGGDDSGDAGVAVSKRTKSTSDAVQQRELEVSNYIKPTDSEKAGINSISSRTTKRYADKDDGDSDGGGDDECDADGDDDIIMNGAPSLSDKITKKRAIQHDDTEFSASLQNTPDCTPIGKRRISQTIGGTPGAEGMASRGSTGTPSKGRLSKKQMMAMKQSHSIEVTNSPVRQTDITDDDPGSAGETTTPKKRFSVVRFASRNSESKRRPVPVYCSSVGSPNLHKRQPSSSHKITKQDYEQDNKLAWKKIQSFLDASDEEEEDKKDSNNNPTGTSSPSIAINVVTCTSPPRSKPTNTLTTTAGGFSSLGQTSSSIAQTASLTTSTTVSTATPLFSTNLLSNPLSTTTSLISTTTSNSTSTTTPGTTPLSTKSATSTAISTTMGGTLGTPLHTSNLGATPSLGLQPSTSSTLASLDPKSTTSALSAASQKSQIVPTGLIAPQQGTSNPLSGPNPLGAASTQSGLKSSSLFSNPIPARSVKPDQQLQSKAVAFGLNSTASNPAIASTTSNLTTTGSVHNPSTAGTNAVGPSMFAGLNKTPTVTTTASGFATTASTGFSFGLKQTTEANKTGDKATFAAAAPTGLFGASSSLTSGTAPKVQDVTKTTTTTATGIQGGFAFGQSAGSQGQQSTPQKPGFTFGNQATSNTSASKNLFGAKTVPGSASSVTLGAPANQNAFGAGSTQSPFGAATTQNAFGARTQNAFGATTTQNAPGASSSQKPFGVAPTHNAFGAAAASTTQPAFGSSSTQKTFGASTTQNAFGSTTTQGTFGASASQNAFGASTNKNAFGASTTQNAFGASTTQKPFGATNSSNTFGAASANATPGQNAFGAAAKPAFGSTTTQNAFGKPTTTGGFGSTFGSQAPALSSGGFNFSASKPPSAASTGGTTGGFNFAAGSTTAGSSSAGGFNFTSGSASNSNSSGLAFGSGGTGNNSNSGGGFTFASAAPQTPSGFNFTSSNTNQSNTSNSNSGFNFASSSNKPGSAAGGFAFGSSSTNQGGFQFGAAQQNSHSNAPAFGSPAASGGFNFTAGAGTPTFGAQSTPGGFAFGSSGQTPSSSVAKARPKATARRRTRK